MLLPSVRFILARLTDCALVVQKDLCTNIYCSPQLTTDGSFSWKKINISMTGLIS